MKFIPILITLVSLHTTARSHEHLNLIRQKQESTGIIWDLPVGLSGNTAAALPLAEGGSSFQLWSITKSKGTASLLDQKLVGAYLPKATAKITTLDPGGAIPRTRVDQPFTLEIETSNLLTGLDFPEAACKVLLEQHIKSYAPGQDSLEPTAVISTPPIHSGHITQNGTTKLQFQASALTASDPTKAAGEEHFVVHVLADKDFSQTQIASACVQVWPIASGEIHGLTPGADYRYQVPAVQLNLDDLYPRSDTYFMLYPGSQIHGVEGKIIQAFPMDRDRCESHILMVEDFSSQLDEDGTYTVALMSKTVFGTELLCDPITFNVRRSIKVNAMQVDFGDDEP
jgi:hypothetical protein